MRSAAAAWLALRPTQQLVIGFAGYALLGTLLLLLPVAQAAPAHPIDHLFNIVSAISTTGLTTISVRDSYTPFGQLVILAMFQVGGIGFMTVSSVLILARGRTLSDSRVSILKAGFALPHYFRIHHFVRQVVVYTLITETIGALILWWRFAHHGIENPLWSAIFHSVSAFATAGFSLNNNSLEPFAHDWIVNLTIGALCTAGAIGFIVFQDVWYSIKLRERMLTLTSKVILWTTAIVFVGATGLLLITDSTTAHLPMGERVLACMFQGMTASTTAGFNTIPIGAMPASALVVLMVAMLIGASPSGTGGGIKTTTVSAILANLISVLRGRSSVVWLGHQVPLQRVLYAFAAASLYLVLLALGVMALTLSERADFLKIVFEAASAIGTVGLSMGITGDLSIAGKLIVIVLMFAGRVGPLTIGLALLRPERDAPTRVDDIAV